MESRIRLSAVSFVGLALASLALAERASAQYTGRFAVTMSFSPGTSGSYTPADMVVLNTTAAGATSGNSVWSTANLGLSIISNPNIDAFSDGTDYIDTTPAATCQEVLIEYTVTSTSAGTSGSLVESEKAGDGAASDVFTKHFLNNVDVYSYLASDHQNIAPTAQIDALAWAERAMYPVFFSVDSATASALSQPVPAGLGFNVRPADILMVSSAGSTPTIFRSHASLGLNAFDDIDALAVDYYIDGTIFVSLAAGSPSLNPASAYPAKTATAAGLIVYKGADPPAVIKTPAELDLLDTDDLTAVRISDPCLSAFQAAGNNVPYAGLADGNEPSPTTAFPWNYETIRVDSHIGNSRRQIWIESTDPPFNVSIKTQYPTQSAVVWVGFGSICTTSVLPVPIAKGFLAFPIAIVLPTIPPGSPPVVLPTPASLLPPGLQINLQGIVSTGLPNEYFMTNVVSLIGVP